MKMKKFGVSVLVCLLFMAFGSSAMARTYVLGTFPIPLMVETEDKGVFVDLTKELAKRAGVKIEIKIAPPPRTIQNFGQNKSDGFFPALDVTLPKAYARSASIYVKRDFVFCKKGKGLTGIADLEGKTVGLTRGYPYTRELIENKKITLEYANDDVTNMRKLSLGRIDAFVVEKGSGLTALEQSGARNIEYNANKVLSEMDVFYAFQKTTENERLAEKFSNALQEIRKDGTFEKIMSKAKQKTESRTQ